MTPSRTATSPPAAADQCSPGRAVAPARPPVPPLPRRHGLPGTIPGQEKPGRPAGPAPALAGGPVRGDLTQLVFRALFRDYELRTVGGIYVAVPAGTAWHAGPSLGEIARQIGNRPPPGPAPARPLPALPIPPGSGRPAGFPAPGDATRLSRFLRDHPHWSVFCDKHHGVWRAAEDDPDSGLHTESPDAATIISYITARS